MRYLAACRLFGLLFVLSSGVALAQGTGTTSTVPLGGNAYITHASPANDETITDTGLHNWDSSQAVISVYFDVQQAGELQLSLVGALNGASHSLVRVSIDRQVRFVHLGLGSPSVIPVGNFFIHKPGYVKVDLQGVSTDGAYYGDISGLQIAGSATAAGTVFANDPANFYWSLRGPSVHLGYSVPANTEYFYSEVTVPKGQDPIGSYYMADGFSVGYFGMQVNSATERRILFSVWDAPTHKTTLVRQGPNVVINNFGGEGTGGQSYLDYPWVAGETYRFLVKAQPDGNGNTDFSAWFGPMPHGHGRHSHGNDSSWHFIASWKYADTATYLKGMYSFLECFDSSDGYIGRSALYGNQWAVGTDGTWSEITSAYFDVDPTGLNKQRLDFAGGKFGHQFFLRNDGFFSHSTTSGTTFTRPAGGRKPNVDLNNLP